MLYPVIVTERPFEEIIKLSSHQVNIHRHICALPCTISISIHTQAYPVPSKVKLMADLIKQQGDQMKQMANRIKQLEKPFPPVDIIMDDF